LAVQEQHRIVPACSLARSWSGPRRAPSADGMPAVVVGLDAFEAGGPTTAGAVAWELAASLDPSLPDRLAGSIEVYRVERVAADAEFAAEDLILCRLRDWPFDLSALDELHRQVQGLEGEREQLQSSCQDLALRLARTQEALEVLAASLEALQEVPPERPPPLDSGGGTGDSSGSCSAQELERLRQQLAASEGSRQDTKESVMALKHEFQTLLRITDCSHLLDISLGAAATGAARQCAEMALKGAQAYRSPPPCGSSFDYCSDMQRSPRLNAQLPLSPTPQRHGGAFGQFRPRTVTATSGPRPRSAGRCGGGGGGGVRSGGASSVGPRRLG